MLQSYSVNKTQNNSKLKTLKRDKKEPHQQANSQAVVKSLHKVKGTVQVLHRAPAATR